LYHLYDEEEIMREIIKTDVEYLEFTWPRRYFFIAGGGIKRRGRIWAQGKDDLA